VPVLHNALAVANSKGGVGKTTLVAHVAGLAAHSGWRTLAVDLDPQGNLARDLGYSPDSGRGLVAAALAGAVPEVIEGVRPGLDVVPGGPETARLADQMLLDVVRTADASGLDRLGASLAPLAADYDLVVMDLPPGEAVIQRAAMRCARFVVIPTTGDAAANDGLGGVFGRYMAERAANPELEVLGVAVTFVGAGASAMLRAIRQELAEMLEGSVTVFEPPVRLAKRAAMDCRAKGLLAHEYEAAKAQAPPWYAGARGESYAHNASGLADDYQQLVGRILASFSERVALAYR